MMLYFRRFLSFSCLLLLMFDAASFISSPRMMLRAIIDALLP